MKLQWFGGSWGAPVCEDAEQVPVPVGQPCADCGELIEPDDQGFMMWHMGADETYSGYRPYHRECEMRMVLGGLGHQLGLCHCPGGLGLWEDPPGVSRRLSAKMAIEVFLDLNKQRLGSN